MEVQPLQGGWSLLVGKAKEPAGGWGEQEHLCLPSLGGGPSLECVYKCSKVYIGAPTLSRVRAVFMAGRGQWTGLGPAHLPDTRHSPCPLILNMFLSPNPI